MRALSGLFVLLATSTAWGYGNQAPVIVSFEASPAPLVAQGVATLSCAATDDTSVARLRLYVSGGSLPGGVALTGGTYAGYQAAYASITPGPSVVGTLSWSTPAPGTYTVVCGVQDGGGGFGALTAFRSVAVTVTEPVRGEPPVVDALEVSHAQVFGGQTVGVNAAAHDPEGEALTYVWTPSAGALSGVGARVDWTLPEAPGAYTLSLVVRDPAGMTATRMAQVAVRVALPAEPVRLGAGAPTRLAIGPRGAIWYADAARRSVEALTPLGMPLCSVSLGGAPGGLAVAPDGTLFVGDLDHRRIDVYDRYGAFLRAIGEGEVVAPLDLALAGDELLIADAGRGAILVYRTSGERQRSLPVEGGWPTGVAVDARGDYVVADNLGLRLQVLSPDGLLVRTIGGSGELGRSAGVTVGRGGELYAVDPYQGRIAAFAADGAFSGFVADGGDELGGLLVPLDAVIDDAGRLLVTSTDNGRLGVFDLLASAEPRCDGDADCDGILDAWEAASGGDPASAADAYTDWDGDGLANLFEALAGTDPRRADTDGDGTNDLDELRAGRDPRDPRDGLPVAFATGPTRTPPARVTLDGTASRDPAGRPLSFVWTQTAGPEVRLLGATTPAPWFVARAAGDLRFALRVDNGLRTSAGAEVAMQVEDLPPVADAGPDFFASPGHTIQLDGRFSADSNGDALRFEWRQIAGPPASLSGERSARPTFAPAAAGRYGFELVARDAVWASAPDTLYVNVQDLRHRLPVAQASASAETAVGQRTLLDGRASLRHGAHTRLAWRQLEGPSVTIEDPTRRRAFFTPVEPGVYRFELGLWTDELEGVPAEVTVQASAPGHHPALADAGPDRRGKVLEPVDLDGEGSRDPDGGEVTCTWRQIEGVPTALEISGCSARLLPLEAGSYAFELAAHDADGPGTRDRVYVAVDDPPGNHVPVAAATVRQEGERIWLDGSASTDADGGSVLHETWTQLEGPPLLEAPGSAAPFLVPRRGRCVLELRVDDGVDRSPPARVVIDVQEDTEPEGDDEVDAKTGRARRHGRVAHSLARRTPGPAQARPAGCSSGGASSGPGLLVLLAPLLLIRRRRSGAALLVAGGLLLAPGRARAVDPPHGNLPQLCLECHTPHNAAGMTLTRTRGNNNLCRGCHATTSNPNINSWVPSQQALPTMSPATTGTGKLHRWDSGVSGWVEPTATNTSTGTVVSVGTFTGRIEKTCLLTITTAGNAGTAVFSWQGSLPNGAADGSGTGLISVAPGSSVALDQGIGVWFQDGSTSPSFRLGDTFTLRVRTDLRSPAAGDPMTAEGWMAIRVTAEGKIMCSTCHDQHTQRNAPPDQTDVPAWSQPGDGWTSSGVGRHYQRVENGLNEACLVCHSARNVTSSSQGSHPIGVTLPAGAFQSPPSLELIDNKVYCTTCHSPHNATSGGASSGAGDGYLLDDSIVTLCRQCHTLADATSGSHFNTTTGVLWPGGQYGSSKFAAPAYQRGACTNCHWPHGWPDDANMSSDYSKLWVERYDTSRTVGADPDDAEDLCFTCHDGAPATSNIRSEFLKGTNGANVYHHPIKDSEQAQYGRSVECVDCHNPHKATAANRNAGVSGVSLAGSAVTEIAVQYEVCLKCHGDTRNTSRTTTNKRLDFQPSNSAFHPVAAQGKNQSSALNGALLGGLTTTSTIRCVDCHNSEQTAGTDYGPVDDSTSATVGPHGSTNATILRAAYPASTTGPGTWSRANFDLCFRCHDPARLVEAQSTPTASTNFYQSGGKDNLHWYHLANIPDKTNATCKNCHYNIHSNRQTQPEGSAHTTQYRIDGTLYSSGPPAGFKTRNVSFSPDILPTGGRAKPEWGINTTTRQRSCYMSCHENLNCGKPMAYTYTPPGGGDNDPLTYTVCVDADTDGYFSQAGCGTAVDCNDANAAVHPGASENTAGLCADGQDNDCNGLTDCADTAGCFGYCCHDADSDTYYAEPSCGTAVDCNDGNPGVHPGVLENTLPMCTDTVDNDCDAQTDCNDSGCYGIGSCPAPCLDADGDMYFNSAGCGTAVDCNDGDNTVYPGAPENTAALCGDGKDNDCDALTDCQDTAGCDVDGDGYYKGGGCATSGPDCNDANNQVNPGAAENTCALCRDGVDNNCGGGTDLADAACAQQLEDTNAECSNGTDGDGDGRTDCHDRSCWTGAQCGGSSATACVSTAGGNNRNCCRPSGTSYACYRAECDGRACDRGGTCDVY